MSLNVMEFACLFWYIMVWLCLDGYEVDKGFEIFMGLHSEIIL